MKAVGHGTYTRFPRQNQARCLEAAEGHAALSGVGLSLHGSLARKLNSLCANIRQQG